MPRIHILSNSPHLNSVAFILILPYGSHAAARRLHGYVGGPYRVAAVDVTGDKFVDIVFGYRMVGVVADEVVGEGWQNYNMLDVQRETTFQYDVIYTLTGAPEAKCHECLGRPFEIARGAKPVGAC